MRCPQSSCGPFPPCGTRALDPRFASLKSDISWFLEQRAQPTDPENTPRQRKCSFLNEGAFAETVKQRRGWKSKWDCVLQTAVETWRAVCEGSKSFLSSLHDRKSLNILMSYVVYEIGTPHSRAVKRQHQNISVCQSRSHQRLGFLSCKSTAGSSVSALTQPQCVSVHIRI